MYIQRLICISISMRFTRYFPLWADIKASICALPMTVSIYILTISSRSDVFFLLKQIIASRQKLQLYADFRIFLINYKRGSIFLKWVYFQ